MGLFSSCINKKYIELICDISNGSVGVALVSHSTNVNVPNVLFIDRIFSSSKQKKETKNIINSVNSDLGVLLARVSAHCVSIGVKPSLVSCFYSSPWFISETNILKIKQHEPIIFSESIIKKALDEGEKSFMSGPDIVANVVENEDLKLIERRITKIKLNGYQTRNPIGKRVFNMEICLFLSAVPRKTISLIEESLDRFWHKIKIQHHSFPLASFSMLRNGFDTHGDFLIIHIASNITEVSFVSDDTLLDTFTFPLGTRNIIESIENNCKLDYELAVSALSMYMKGEIHQDNTKHLTEAIELAKKDWISHFENAYNVLTKKSKIPNFAYLITDQKVQPFFESAIQKSSLGGYATAERELKVYPVARDFFSKYLSYTQPSPHKDFFLETEILYTDLVSSRTERIIGNYIIE